MKKLIAILTTLALLVSCAAAEGAAPHRATPS